MAVVVVGGGGGAGRCGIFINNNSDRRNSLSNFLTQYVEASVE